MLKFGRQNVPDTSDAGGRGARSSARASDPNDDLKRKARQRLIGAVILVLTAIIVVPMLLDSEPRPLGQDIAISIPPKDAPFNGNPPNTGTATPSVAPTTATPANAPAANAAAPATATPANSPSAAAPATVPPAPAGSTTVTPVAPVVPEAAKPAVAESSAAKPAVAKPVESPKPEAAKTEATKPAAAPKPDASKPAVAPKEVDGDKALALLEGKAAAKPVASGKFVVQVGAFASEEKVKELQARLKTAGLSTYTEKVKTDAGERIRLRAGPFGTHADAESVLGKIKAAGINGAVIVQ